jgi:hypothetical protein
MIYHNLKFSMIILITIFILHSCKDECGCDAEPYKTVINAEAIYYYDIAIYFLDNLETSFAICNLDIVPEEIKLKAKSKLLDGISVIVSGDLHKGCKDKMESYIPNGITLTEIRLSDNPLE